MTKQLALATDTEFLSEIPEGVRETFIGQFKEWELEQKQCRYGDTTVLLSEDEIEQFNTAVERIADKLGISGELATIDALLTARNTRAARILTAAYSTENRVF